MDIKRAGSRPSGAALHVNRNLGFGAFVVGRVTGISRIGQAVSPAGGESVVATTDDPVRSPLRDGSPNGTVKESESGP